MNKKITLSSIRLVSMRSAVGATMVLFSSAVLGGCSAQGFTFANYGVMREVMRGGQSEARIRLADAVAEPHAYGVGALEGLAGEVTIVDGRVWVARSVGIGQSVDVSGPEPNPGAQATMLTVSHVNSWQSAPIGPASSEAELESLIEETSKSMGIDTSVPFPFILEGKSMQVEMHVMNGYCPMATDPATMDAKPWTWSSEQPAAAVLVGFFAPNAGGVMTHHGTSVHMHAVITTDAGTLTGHVDGAAIGAGTILRVPVVR